MYQNKDLCKSVGHIVGKKELMLSALDSSGKLHSTKEGIYLALEECLKLGAEKAME